nr:hypothetical protein [Angustibacter aerolatus]
MGPPGAARPARPDRRPVPVGPVGVRLGELVLRRRRPGRLGVLEGVLLRLVRRRERDHSRQAAGIAVVHGAVDPAVRAQARGACWCRRRSWASRPWRCCTRR